MAEVLPPATQRELLKRFPPRPEIYWADLVGCAAVGWGAFAAAWALRESVGLRVALLVVAALGLYRGAYFLHEMAHRKSTELPFFVPVWHLLIGLPGQLPSLMIEAHAEHHRPLVYGTDGDPEYEAVVDWGTGKLVLEVLLPVLAPPLLLLRWAVLAPLSAVVPPLRRLVWERASTLAINPRFRRRPPHPKRQVEYRLQEGAAAVVAWAAIGAWWVELLPTGLVLQWWAAMGLALGINALRTLVSHFFENAGMQTVSREYQVLDSVTVEARGPLAELFWPLGTKFHALHHACQGLPYHALGTAHRELMRTLPEDHPYRQTVVRGFGEAMALLWLGRGRPRVAEDPG